MASAFDNNLVGTFRLNTPTIALFSEDGRQVAHTVPAGAVVTSVDGRVSELGFLDVIWDVEKISMFAVDLRGRGQKVFEASACLAHVDEVSKGEVLSVGVPQLFLVNLLQR